MLSALAHAYARAGQEQKLNNCSLNWRRPANNNTFHRITWPSSMLDLERRKKLFPY